MAMATGAIAAVLLLATLAIAAIESWTGIGDASATYLLAVVAVAVRLGSAAAVATAIGAFLVYNALFVEPIGTLLVSDPREWLNLLLFLLIGLLVAQLAGRQRERAEAALVRERQARALYQVSRALATSPNARDALPAIAGILRTEQVGSRAWVSLADGQGPERPVADSGGPRAPAVPATHQVVRLATGDELPEWVRVHDPRFGSPGSVPGGEASYRVPIETPGGSRGSIWVARERAAGTPGHGDTRVLLSVADQLVQALERDRLAEEAVSAAVARRSEAAKTALLDSVAHDLRTPLAAIRAAAGSLADPEALLDERARRARAAAIDRDAARLSRLVTNLLDLSRIEAGDLRGRSVILVLEDVVGDAVERHAGLLAGRPLTVEIAPDLPPVEADEVFLDQVLANLLENAATHTPAGSAIRISAAATGHGRVRLAVEDGGPGVAVDDLPGLFQRSPARMARGGRAGRGTGIGLVVVRGLVQAMGGSVEAGRSALGGLQIDVDLLAARRLEEVGPAEARTEGTGPDGEGSVP